MNNKKIACISCVNDETEYAQQLYYLNRQILPEGFSLEFWPVRGASSMASGYNLAMAESDAKYKVYAHQDAFLVNPHALKEAVALFENHPEIGLMGVVGVSDLRKHGFHTMDYDRGKVDHNSYPHDLRYDAPTSPEIFSPVESVDGMFIITAYDLPWREDIFNTWDFYDASQCQEFLRAGYKVAVPYQSAPWCYHDNTYSNMLSYYDYKAKYIKEYFPDIDYSLSESGNRAIEYAQIQKDTISSIRTLAESNQRSMLYEIFKNNDFRGHAHLRELEAVTDVDYLEHQSNSALKLWKDNESIDTALFNLRQLKFLVKQLEYKACDNSSAIIKQIHSEYSAYAVYETIEKYCVDTKAMHEMLS